MILSAATPLLPLASLAAAQIQINMPGSTPSDTPAGAQDISLAGNSGYVRDTRYPACPLANGTAMEDSPPIKGSTWGPAPGDHLTDDPVKFIGNGTGACAFAYSETTPGVCLSAGEFWSAFGLPAGL